MSKAFKLPKVSVRALYPSDALKHGHNETLEMRVRHNKRIFRAGGRSRTISRNTERAIDQRIENERKKKSRKIFELLKYRDNIPNENPEEYEYTLNKIDEKIRSLKQGGRKNKTKKNRKKKGGSKNCGCGSTPQTVISYPAGSSSSMSPNPNSNIQSAQQQFANSACASTGDAMGDSWSQTGGSDLGKFIENLNNMSGGKKKKRKNTKPSKKNRKNTKKGKKGKKTKKIKIYSKRK
jgi:hypothetical protein